MLLLQVGLLTGTRRVSFARLASKVSHSIASHNVPCTLEKESRSEWLVVLSSQDQAGHFGRVQCTVHSGAEQDLQVVGVVVANSALHGTLGKVSP